MHQLGRPEKAEAVQQQQYPSDFNPSLGGDRLFLLANADTGTRSFRIYSSNIPWPPSTRQDTCIQCDTSTRPDVASISRCRSLGAGTQNGAEAVCTDRVELCWVWVERLDSRLEQSWHTTLHVYFLSELVLSIVQHIIRSKHQLLSTGNPPPPLPRGSALFCIKL
jgi:hypothetical protein